MKLTKNDKLKHKYMWRDKEGNFHDPTKMETRHVFFTLRMIWNHHAPLEARIEPYKRYRFFSFYTTEYLSQSIKVLMTELKTRKDIAPYWRKNLDHMIAYSMNKSTPIKELSEVQNGTGT